MDFKTKLEDDRLIRQFNSAKRTYINNRLKDTNNDEIDTQDIINILIKYFDAIKSYIETNDCMQDLIMQEKCEYNNILYNLIRHDLDIFKYVDFNNIFKCIENNNNYGLNSFEKRAKILMITIACNLINIYGLKELEENPAKILKEFKYNTFYERQENTDEDYCEIINKIGDAYGVEAIEKIKDLNLLEERLKSMLTICKNQNERAKIEAILSKVTMIQLSLPIDVRLKFLIIYMRKTLKNKCIMHDEFNIESIEDFKTLKKRVNEQMEDFIQRNELYLKKYPTNKKGPLVLEISYCRTALEIISQTEEEYKKIIDRKVEFEQIIPENQMINELKNVFDSYNQINREFLLDRIGDKPFNINEDNPDQLLLVHFFTDFDSENDSDGINLAKRIKRTLKKKIENETGKRFSSKRDGMKLQEYYKAARNPLSFTRRVPTKIQYMLGGREMFLTKPTSLISMTIAKKDALSCHLDRKIGFGCLRQSVPPDAIYTITIGYNISNDKNIFSKHQAPISELIGVQETMVDWNKITADYIIYVRTEEKMEESEDYKKACRLSEESGLPLVIYDHYSLNIEKQNSDKDMVE